jgi:hypothetical protein
MDDSYARCFHCKELGHWEKHCPLLIPPEDKDQHEERIARAVERLGNGEIGPLAKRRIIETENKLWKKKQREMAN